MRKGGNTPVNRGDPFNYLSAPQSGQKDAGAGILGADVPIKMGVSPAADGADTHHD
ncbi:MAG: hypothetical protein Fur0021_05580 [Candidatus Promineifilaceae bacterium]